MTEDLITAEEYFRGTLKVIAHWSEVDLSAEWETGLRGIIRSITDAAKEVLSAHPEGKTNPGAAMAEPVTVAADLDGGDARPNRRLDSSDRGHLIGVAQAAAMVTYEMVQRACETYSEVYVDDDKDMGDAMRAVLVEALAAQPPAQAAGDAATDQAKALVEEAWRQTCAGPGEFDDYVVPLIAAALAAEPAAPVETEVAKNRVRHIIKNLASVNMSEDAAERQARRMTDALESAGLIACRSSADTEDDDRDLVEGLSHRAIDYTLDQLCKFLGVDPASVTWDAATETVDGDVQAVIGNILRAKYGEDWGPDDTFNEPQEAPLTMNSIDAFAAEIAPFGYHAENNVIRAFLAKARERFASTLSRPERS